MNSEYTSRQWPVPRRPDTDAVMINFWRAPTVERQRRFTRDLVDGVWGRELPDGQLGFALYESQDGRSVMAYKQWTSKAAYDALLAVRGFEGARAFREANPDVDFQHDWYTVYRGTGRPDEPRVPGWVVMVDITPDSPEAGKRWVDRILESDNGSDPFDLISTNFHINLNGTRILNYAEWTTAEAHELAVKSGQADPEWRKLVGSGGVSFNGFTRYRLTRSISRPVPGD